MSRDWFVVTALVVTSLTAVVVAMSDEKKLIKSLLSNYERIGLIGRPVQNTSEQIKVKYGLNLIQILDLDEKDQVLTTNVWCRYTWNDILLRWNPDNYGGVDHVRVPVNKIWKPDIVLYNYADTRLKELRETMAVVSSNGDVLWIPPAIFKSTCAIDILTFPFDVQICHLKFGSWTYDGNKLDLDFLEGLDRFDVTDYVPSNEWALLDYPAKKNVQFYPCCSEPFTDLTFTLRVKRIAIFYSFILIVPCVLLSLLTLVSFWLPPETPAKILLGMNIFVAFFLLLRILADSTPPASATIPLIGALFCLNMILITLSSFLSITVINLYMHVDKTNAVPSWLRKVAVIGLARSLCMEGGNVSKPVRDHVTHHMTHVIGAGGMLNASQQHAKKTIKSPIMPYNKWEQPPSGTTPVTSGGDDCKPGDSSPITPRRLVANHRTSMTDYPSQRHVVTSQVSSQVTNSAIETEVREIKNVLRSFMMKIHQKDVKDKVAQEWRLVALALDRLFFLIYLITIIISLVAIFPWNEALSTGQLLQQ